MKKTFVLLLALCMAAVFLRCLCLQKATAMPSRQLRLSTHTGSFGTGPCRSCTSRRHGNTGRQYHA